MGYKFIELHLSVQCPYIFIWHLIYILICKYQIDGTMAENIKGYPEARKIYLKYMSDGLYEVSAIWYQDSIASEGQRRRDDSGYRMQQQNIYAQQNSLTRKLAKATKAKFVFFSCKILGISHFCFTVEIYSLNELNLSWKCTVYVSHLQVKIY